MSRDSEKYKKCTIGTFFVPMVPLVMYHWILETYHFQNFLSEPFRTDVDFCAGISIGNIRK